MKRIKSFLTALLFAAAFIACDNGTAGDPTTPPVTPPVTPPAQPQIPITGAAVQGFESYDLSIPDFMKKHGIAGGAVAVMRSGKLIYARGYGYADVETKTPVQPDALFRIASLSKPITSAAILKLVEDGKLSLADRVAPLIADLSPPPGAAVDPRWEQITIRHLLTHTGGWDRTIPGGIGSVDLSVPAATALNEPVPASAETIIRYIKGLPLDFNPGAKYVYSNLGYTILGRVIERLSGMKYEDFVRIRVLQPVGATRTQPGRSLLKDALPEEVRYYLLGLSTPVVPSIFPGESPAPVPYAVHHLEAIRSSGAWVSSTVDLLRFLGGIDGRADRPDILSAATISEMTVKGASPGWTCADGSSCYYALGWRIKPTLGEPIWVHDGALHGSTSFIVRSSNNVSYVALFNSGSASPPAGFYPALEALLSALLQGVTSFPTHDLFPSFK